MAVSDEQARALLDIATSSMDWGSGFLDSPEVELLRAVATELGVDPMAVTPHEHRPNYCPGHEWGTGEAWRPNVLVCRHCRKTQR